MVMIKVMIRKQVTAISYEVTPIINTTTITNSHAIHNNNNVNFDLKLYGVPQGAILGQPNNKIIKSNNCFLSYL